VTGSRRFAKALVTLFCVAVAVGGWSVSYATQADLAAAHHFASWEAWIWPAIADSAALAVMLRLHMGMVRSGWPVVEAWGHLQPGQRGHGPRQHRGHPG
jgi:hypothetical protein